MYQNRLATMKERAPILIARVLAAKKGLVNFITDNSKYY